MFAHEFESQIAQQQTAAGPMTAERAKALTEKIRTAVDNLWELLVEAHEKEAWRALGYNAWASYVETEFHLTRRRSYQIIDQGKVIHALRDAAGDVCTDVH